MSCSAKQRWSRDGERKKQSERIKKVLADPERGAAMLAAGKANMRKGRIVPKVWNKGGLAAKLPAELRDDYRALSKKIGRRAAYEAILDEQAIHIRRQGLASSSDLGA